MVNIQELERQYDITILYLTEYGSKLYGTADKNSDTDIRGVFLPSKDSLLLGQVNDNIGITTGNTNSKNSESDVDITLHSIHKFFNLLQKGETGSLDVLFSMWSGSILYENKQFVEWCKTNYKQIVTSKVDAFVGYSIQMQKRYNIKGARFSELVLFKELLTSKYSNHKSDKIELLFPLFGRENSYKYIMLVEAPAPRGLVGDWTYLEVLGRKYAFNVTIDYLIDTVDKLIASYGYRVKNTDSFDYKSLYHSVRVIDECLELVSSGFITFPRPNAVELYNIKQGKVEVDEIMQRLTRTSDTIDSLIPLSALVETSDTGLFNNYILSLYKDD